MFLVHCSEEIGWKYRKFTNVCPDDALSGAGRTEEPRTQGLPSPAPVAGEAQRAVMHMSSELGWMLGPH